ncbi:MAG: cell division protein FtsA [Longicatena sp.]|nr:cell division protein FtsA [Longicatena sp.]
MIHQEIYASVEIADHEVRLIVGQLYDTRFHVLRVERCRIVGNSGRQSEDDIADAIIKVVENAKQALGFRVESVLLAIPSKNVERHVQQIHVIPEVSSRRIRLSDIQKGLNQAISFKPEEHLELVNVGCTKYVTNGITSRKMPIDEITDLLRMDVDLLFADKATMYSYARCIEKAGLQILDVCLDSYAIAQEAAVFEQTVDKYVIQIAIERNHTTLSLFTSGKLVNCEYLEMGYESWLKELSDAYRLNTNVAFRLAQNTCQFDLEKASDQIIYVWSENKVQKSITEKESASVIVPHIQRWIAKINDLCEKIIESKEVHIILTGEGCEINALSQVLDELKAPWKIYVPQTIGARDASLTVCMGLFYGWNEMKAIRKDHRISVNPHEVDNALRIVKPRNEQEEGGFTKKLKNILLSDK